MTAGFKIKAVTIPERDIEHKPLYQQHDIEEREAIKNSNNKQYDYLA